MESSGSSGGKVLVVDDIEQNRELVSAHLTSSGYETVLVTSGEEGIKALVAQPFDLVLLDVMMPGLDGFETCRRMRGTRFGTDVAIVFLTALSDLGSHQEAMSSGADDFLTKPINRTELLMRVRSLIWLKRLKDELRTGYDLIRTQRDALLVTQRMKEEYTGFVVHDLKSPLTGILSNAEWVVSMQGLPPQVKESVEDILESATSMHRMILNLLDISRSEDGAPAPKLGPVDMGALLEAISVGFARRLRDTGQRLEVAMSLQSPMIRADEEMLRRLMDNLVDNAVRHAPLGDCIRIEARPADPGWIELRVSDKGPGVPESERERIFEKYYRLSQDEQRLSPARSSRGMGLAYCRLAAEAHGGRIWVEENVPYGCVFCVGLPVRGAGQEAS